MTTLPIDGSVHTATSPLWFGLPERPQAGWLTVPVGGEIRAGVLILPPIGYEYWNGHRTLRVLAERLAGQGYAALRIDYDGTGDSAGSPRETDRVAAWTATVAAGAQVLRDAGLRRITVVGAQFGGTLAVLGAAGPVDAVVAWNPVVSGRRFVRQLKLLATTAPDDAPTDAVVHAGVLLTPATLAEVSRIDGAKLVAPQAPRLLVVARPDRPCDELTAAAAAVTSVEHCVLAGSEIAFDVPTEDAVVPEAIIDAITGWLGPVPADQIAEPVVLERLVTGADADRQPVAPAGAEATITWQRTQIVEQVVRIGPRGLVAVHGRPAGKRPSTVVTFFNSGSEPHVGPGRSWVEYCRELNVRGFATVRVDFSGWGESPDFGHAPGRPYDSHCVAEADEIVAALRASGMKHVVLTGLCAGAWIALASAEHADVAGVIAINPQLYWWPGDPIEALVADTRARRAPERRRIERAQRLGLWSFLDAIGIRHRGARRLARLRRRHVPVVMLFAEADDGLEFLQTRCERALRREQRAGSLQVVEIPGIDHQMHREWRRVAVVECMQAFLAQFPPGTAGDVSGDTRRTLEMA